MGLIEFYTIFAFTTAVVTIYELVWPVIQQIRISHKELNVARQWKLTVTVFFVMSFAVAPFLIIPCLWPSKGESFRRTLYQALQTTQ